MSITISAWKRCLDLFYLQLFLGGICLIYVISVCLLIVVSNAYFVESGVKLHNPIPTYIALCFWFVCLLLVYPMLPVSLCCVLFVSFLCTLCCQFLWIVHFWLPLRYSLTFILFYQYNHLLYSYNYNPMKNAHLWHVTFFSVLYNRKSHLSILHSFYKGHSSCILLSLAMVKKANKYFNCSGGVIVSVLALFAVDRVFEAR